MNCFVPFKRETITACCNESAEINCCKMNRSLNNDNWSGLLEAATHNGSEKQERLWLRDEICAGVLTGVAFYLVFGLSCFEWRRSGFTRAKGKEGNSKTTLCKRIDLFLTRGKLCLIAAVFTFLRCLGEQIELRFGRTSDTACLIYEHLYVYNYQIALLSLYLLLWSRQRKLYRHRTLRHLSSAKLRLLSGTVIVGIFASSFVTVVIYFFSFKLVSSPVGCVYHVDSSATSSSGTPNFMMFASACIFQFVLMGLLLYPLVRHYHIGCDLFSKEDPPHAGTHNVRKTVLRIAICTTVCVVSDFVVATTMAVLHTMNSPIMFWANVYSLNLIVNIIAVTWSFVDCRKRFLPCYKVNYQAVSESQHTCNTSTLV